MIMTIIIIIIVIISWLLLSMSLLSLIGQDRHAAPEAVACGARAKRAGGEARVADGGEEGDLVAYYE